ncbi:hypothetical protein TDB9533_03987 [Thalassocella blandensis]|nr:hypothetical protein TDB9533_03987 [Thalassocella blandensis]
MKKRSITLLAAIAILSIQACTPVPVYEAEAGVNMASMSFSTTDVQRNTTPNIYLRTSQPVCKNFQIPAHVIEYRRPTEISQSQLPLDASGPVELNVTFESIASVKNNAITLNGSGTMIYQPEREISVDVCEKTIRFLPVKDKHYEIYFGVNRGQCFLRVLQAKHIDQKNGIFSASYTVSQDSNIDKSPKKDQEKSFDKNFKEKLKQASLERVTLLDEMVCQ